MSQVIATKFLCEITVKDSKNNEQILEVHEAKDGNIFAVDCTYLDQVTTIINSPYDAGIQYDCSSDEIDESDKQLIDFLNRK